MTSNSVKTRLLFSLLINIFKAGLGFFAGIIVARGLSPAGYGDYSFLLGSFVAIRTLLDMGSSSAFFTFISQLTRDRSFYIFYFVWLLVQFVITILIVALLIPHELFIKIWLDNSREVVILAFLAVFMQQQVWQMINQIGESKRKTLRIQFLNIVISITFLIVVGSIWILGTLTIKLVFEIIVVQYILFLFPAYWVLKENQIEPQTAKLTFKQIFKEYVIYCRPLVWLNSVGFLYAFFNKWMLQKYGGSVQQGFFQVASQFAAVSLIATTSILNIFWKEVAYSIEKKDFEKVAILYQKINRGLVMLSSVITGFLLPWSPQIVMVMLGEEYKQSWPVFAIMLLYPIHQSMGQIGGTMFLANGSTEKYMKVGLINMFIFLPFAYFLMAPTTGMLIPGIGWGATGMATYSVLSNTCSVNIQAWVIAREGGWKYDWKYQLVGIPLVIIIGWLAKILVSTYWTLDSDNYLNLVVPCFTSGIIYLSSVALLIIHLPWLIGMEKRDIFIGRLR